MCYDIQSSLKAFFFSQMIGWLGVCKGFYWFSFTVITFSTIQLVDAFLWMSQKNKKMNRLISTFVLPLIFIMEMMVAYYLGPWRNKLWEIGLWIFSIVLFFNWVRFCTKPSYPAKDGFLFWCELETKSPSKLLMFFFLVGPFAIAYPNIVVRFLIVLISTFTFVHSFSKPNWGTHWCYTNNILSLILLLEILWNETKKCH